MSQQQNAPIHPVLLSAISGILLWLSWPTSPLTFLVFISWIPLLQLETQGKRLLPFFGLVYVSMLLWNGATTWWVSNTPVPVSGILAAVLNSLLMTLPWIGYWKARRRFGYLIGYTALAAYWMAFEYIHLNWELSWPWLTLGNAFAGHPGWVQWYEWTGCAGGGLWIWAVNILFFEVLRSGRLRAWKPWRPVILVLAIPLLISLGISLYRQSLKTQPRTGPDMVVVQPNIDPYNEKFVNGTEAQQLIKLITLSESAIDSSTAFVLWPETAIPFEVDESRFNQAPELKPLRLFLQRHPRLRLITGLAGMSTLSPDTVTLAMRVDPASGLHYEEYNSALQTNASGTTGFYHKGKLVPGAEIIPYSWLFGFLEKMSLDMGGTSGTLGRGPVRSVFSNPDNSYRVAPIICYESIYGSYITGFIRGGANVLAIITNDGWWGDSQGYRQHQQYARLRAIETRRWVARSANTGISCFIDPLGEVFQAQPWNTTAVIKMVVPTENTLTLYARLGDWISVLAISWSILLFGWSIYNRLTHKK